MCLTKKEIKRLYDKQYRIKNAESIKQKKKIYNESEAGRLMQKRHREKKKQYHLEYCRTDKYKAYKKKYDQIYRAKKKYGEFWEAAVILFEIEDIIDSRQVNFDKGTYNKSQKRKRKQVY